MKKKNQEFYFINEVQALNLKSLKLSIPKFAQAKGGQVGIPMQSQSKINKQEHIWKVLE
jgi:hypothetical protein